MTTRIFLDSCMVIDLVEARLEQQTMIKGLIRGKWVCGSELVRMEARLKPLKENRADLLAIYDRYFDQCELVPFDRALFDRASRLRIDHRLKTPDALHLATALIARCDQFWTNDNTLADVAKNRIEVWDWERLEQAAKQQEQA
jgi:predicted nucleic acid-binding protein